MIIKKRAKRRMLKETIRINGSIYIIKKERKVNVYQGHGEEENWGGLMSRWGCRSFIIRLVLYILGVSTSVKGKRLTDP